jgi:hypothetical protein
VALSINAGNRPHAPLVTSDQALLSSDHRYS